MALLGFSMLKDALLYGNKRQTIRKLRKTPIKKGERLHLYFKLRTPQCESLGSWACTETFYIRFFGTPLGIQLIELVGENKTVIVQHTMTDDEALDLAKRDGFNSVQELFTALEKMHGPQDGSQIFQVIRW